MDETLFPNLPPLPLVSGGREKTRGEAAPSLLAAPVPEDEEWPSNVILGSLIGACSKGSAQVD